jgi:hypothetical protein
MLAWVKPPGSVKLLKAKEQEKTGGQPANVTRLKQAITTANGE